MKKEYFSPKIDLYMFCLDCLIQSYFEDNDNTGVWDKDKW